MVAHRDAGAIDHVSRGADAGDLERAFAADRACVEREGLARRHG